jgi:hypothetical protein
VNEFSITGAGEEICVAQDPSNISNKYYTKERYSYAASNSLNANLRYFSFRFPNIAEHLEYSTTHPTNSNFNSGYNQSGYRVSSLDNRYGYKRFGSGYYTRNNSSGYDRVYGICRKRLN